MEAIKRLLGFKHALIFEEKLTMLLLNLRNRANGAETVFVTKSDGLVVAESHKGGPEDALLFSAVGAEIAVTSAIPIWRLLEGKSKFIIAITDQNTIGLAHLSHGLILGIVGNNFNISWLLRWLEKTATKINDLFDTTFYELNAENQQKSTS